jgi:hypothetical protein
MAKGIDVELPRSFVEFLKKKQEEENFDFELDSSEDKDSSHGDTACGKAGRKHRMKRRGPMSTTCIYPGCNRAV